MLMMRIAYLQIAICSSGHNDDHDAHRQRMRSSLAHWGHGVQHYSSGAAFNRVWKKREREHLELLSILSGVAVNPYMHA